MSKNKVYVDMHDIMDSANIWEASQKKGVPVAGFINKGPHPDYKYFIWFEPRDNHYVVEWEGVQ